MILNKNELYLIFIINVSNEVSYFFMYVIVCNIWLLEEWGILGYIVYNIVMVFKVIYNY